MHLFILVLHNESEYNYFVINLDEVGEPIEYEEVELVDTCIFIPYLVSNIFIFTLTEKDNKLLKMIEESSKLLNISNGEFNFYDSYCYNR